MDRSVQLNFVGRIIFVCHACLTSLSRISGRRLFALILMIGIFEGCNAGVEEESGWVTGQVTYQGTPVTEATVMFTNPEQHIAMTAQVDEEGKFRIRRAGTNGLPLGSYQVTVSPPRVDLPLGPPPPGWQDKKYPNIPDSYRNPATSNLSATVADGENVFAIEMK